MAGGLAVVQRLKEKGERLCHPIELYGFNAEESNPLGGTFGSRAVAGLISPNQPNLAQALAQYGRTVPEIMSCRRDFTDAKCYLELHIVQGEGCKLVWSTVLLELFATRSQLLDTATTQAQP